MARRLVLALWLVGAAMLLAWLFQFEGAPWRTAVLACALLVAAAAAARAIHLGAGVQLQWNGQDWSCDGPVRLGGASAAVRLDLQSLMLLRLHAPGQQAAWIWAERASCPARWLDLRRALHASASVRPAGADVVAQP